MNSPPLERRSTISRPSSAMRRRNWKLPAGHQRADVEPSAKPREHLAEPVEVALVPGDDDVLDPFEHIAVLEGPVHRNAGRRAEFIELHGADVTRLADVIDDESVWSVNGPEDDVVLER